MFDEIKPKITAALTRRSGPSKEHTTHQLQQMVRRTIGSWVAAAAPQAA